MVYLLIWPCVIGHDSLIMSESDCYRVPCLLNVTYILPSASSAQSTKQQTKRPPPSGSGRFVCDPAGIIARYRPV